MTLTPSGKAKDVLIHFPLLCRHRVSSFILFTRVFDCLFTDPFWGIRHASMLVGVGGKEHEKSVEGPCFCRIQAALRVLSRDSNPTPDAETVCQGRLPQDTGKLPGSLRGWTDHDD